jgi:hypothetical protein
MVQTIIDLNEKEDRILNIVKAKFGLKNKAQAVTLIAKAYASSFLEPGLRPEYIEKLDKIEKEGYTETFSSIEDLKKSIEGN